MSLTDDLRTLIRDNKPSLLDWLTAANDPAPEPEPEPPADPNAWRELSEAYNAHHFDCHAVLQPGAALSTARAAVRVRRCGSTIKPPEGQLHHEHRRSELVAGSVPYLFNPRSTDMVTKKATAKKPASVVVKPTCMAPHDIVLSSNTQNAIGILAWSKFAGEADLQALVNDLGEQTKNVQGGDMRPVEGMLYRQAKTLETMFTHLTERASKQENMKWFQTYLTLALKTQAQCRSTLEALAEIKNPRSVAFVKQANVTTGPQQINNGSAAQSPARSFQSEPNKLLEADHGNYLDTRAQGQTGRVNQTVDAVG